MHRVSLPDKAHDGLRNEYANIYRVALISSEQVGRRKVAPTFSLGNFHNEAPKVPNNGLNNDDNAMRTSFYGENEAQFPSKATAAMQTRR